ncbi:MAG TPA: phage minor head protein [Anaerolineaceae bacterium]|nr:phage minor head protein [Anaerolineaceae bacterium]
MPTITDFADQFMKALRRNDVEALGRLARTYKVLYDGLTDKLDAYLLALSKLESPTKGQVFRLAQYRNLLKAVEAELSKYSAYVEFEIRAGAEKNADLALRMTQKYLGSLGYSLPKSLPANTFVAMLGYLQEGSPLWDRLEMLSKTHAMKLADALLEGEALGYSPIKVARTLQTIMGGGLTDAMRMTRTTMLYASREASRSVYLANSDIVEGWVWHAALDSTTCVACLAMHGTKHSLDERMDSHYNCRCTSLPIVKGYDDVYQTGEEWFSQLAEAQQRQVLGQGAWQAWKDGKFKFSELAGRRHDDVFGEMLSRVPLSELIEG